MRFGLLRFGREEFGFGGECIGAGQIARAHPPLDIGQYLCQCRRLRIALRHFG